MSFKADDKKIQKRNPRIERLLKKRGPQIIENTKNVLIMKGHSASQTINDILKDITLLTKPCCKTFNRNNDILPFEDPTSIEYLGQKNDCSIVVLGSHTKKRPNNLILVTEKKYCFNIIVYKIALLFEIISSVELLMVMCWICSSLGSNSYYQSNSLKEGKNPQVLKSSSYSVSYHTVRSKPHRLVDLNNMQTWLYSGAKPMILFQGDQWDIDSTFNKIQNFLLGKHYILQ